MSVDQPSCAAGAVLSFSHKYPINKEIYIFTILLSNQFIRLSVKLYCQCNLHALLPLSPSLFWMSSIDQHSLSAYRELSKHNTLLQWFQALHCIVCAIWSGFMIWFNKVRAYISHLALCPAAWLFFLSHDTHHALPIISGWVLNIYYFKS